MNYLIALTLVVLAVLLEIISMLRGKEYLINKFIVFCSSLFLLIELVTRSINIGFPALTNTYEALFFFSASILIILGVLKIKKRANNTVSFGGVIVVLILLLISSSPIIPKELNPPIPALQSNWLLLHVSFSFIGQSFFVISFITAIASLVSKTNREKYRKLTIKTIIIGYPIYTAGAIIFGSIWASSAWGAFWSWDNKEIWALITWIVYTIIIHGRLTKYIRESMIAWLAIVGFLVSIFTFFGVNFLLKSLHSYS